MTNFKNYITLISLILCNLVYSNINDFNKDWFFVKQENRTDSFSADFDKSQWQKVDLPHTFNPSGSSDVYRNQKAEVVEQVVVWYRKNIFIDESLKGKRLFMKFNAAYIDSDFYVNATHIGNHKGGYSAFVYEITNDVVLGKENVFSVKVSNKYNKNINPLGGGYVKFGGITRPVEFIVKENICISPLHFASSGVYFKPKNISEKSAQADVEVLIDSAKKSIDNIDVVCSLIDADGKLITSSSVKSTSDKKSIVLPISVDKPNLWQGKKNPYCYSLKVELFEGGKLLDGVTQSIGFRCIEIDRDNGFFLNGESYPLYGVAQHQYFPKVGSALRKEHFDSDMAELLDLGANAIRLSHYPHSQYRLDLCDKHGIVVLSEIAFIANFFGTDEFAENLEQQVQEMVYQLYNHPSIAIWGLFNEIRADSIKGFNVLPLLEKINAVVKNADPKRFTIGVSWKAGARNDIADLSGWNRYQGWYWPAYRGDPSDFSWIDNMRKEFPNRILGITEYSAGGTVNHFDENRKIAPFNSDQFHPVDYFNYSHEEHWKQIVKRKWLWGSFIWTMSEFLVPGYDQSKMSYLHDKGLIAEGNTERKDAYYFYKANWRKDVNVFHLSYKNFRFRFQPFTEITVYSNIDNVSLKVNGVDMGTLKNAPYGIYRFSEVELSKGDNIVEVYGIDKNKKLYKESATFTYVDDIANSKDINSIFEHSQKWKVKFLDEVLETKRLKGSGVPGEQINAAFNTSLDIWADSKNWEYVKLPLCGATQVSEGNWQGKMVLMTKDFNLDKDVENAYIYIKQTAELSKGDGGRVSIAIDGKNVFTNEEGCQEYRYIPIYDRSGTLKKGSHTISIIANRPKLEAVLDVGLYYSDF